MAYSLQWRTTTLPYTQKQTAINVPPGTVVANAASVSLTGKGAANYGAIQQTNMLYMLENFAGPTAPPFPTVGQTWYDTAQGALRVCVATAPEPETWRSMNATQITDVGDGPPSPAALGDSWFQRTGSMSGIQYVYTGAGRFPEVAWNAVTSGYFPATSNTMAGKLNYIDFNSQDYGEVYISGMTGGSQADIDGSILINGVPTVAPRDTLPTSLPVDNGYILLDNSGTLTNAQSSSYFSIRQLDDGTWQYDNDASSWVTFTPIADMYVVGLVTVLEQDDHTAPGVGSVTIWEEARDLREMTQVPLTRANGAIGGWEQMFPDVELIAGREEYSYVLDLVAQLIGDAAAFKGAGAIGRSIDGLTNFSTLDASLQLAWLNTLPADTNVLQQATLLGQLVVAPSSNDWDQLLAAAKYAVNRLELPVGMVQDISDMPFVYDGRPAPASLLAISPADPVKGVMIPSDRRKTNTKSGYITLTRLYQETVNVLLSAISNRYVLKGIQGTSGVNTSFGPTVTVDTHASFTAAGGAAFAGTVTNGLTFNFNTDDLNLERFFYAGQALEVIVRSSGGSGTPDLNLAAVANGFGRFRITNDAVYIMDNSVTPALTQVPGSIGFSSITTSSTLLATVSSGAASISLRGQLNGLGVLRIYVDITAGGATSTSGTVTVVYNTIKDGETYNGSTPVFPSPIAYQAADKLGSSSFT